MRKLIYSACIYTGLEGDNLELFFSKKVKFKKFKKIIKEKHPECLDGEGQTLYKTLKSRNVTWDSFYLEN